MPRKYTFFKNKKGDEIIMSVLTKSEAKQIAKIAKKLAKKNGLINNKKPIK
ncbi:hypothetical protein [Chengkuizengella axinellae]|uniref:Uncharacterized protein n=1 Tax=Chengkuizengella axinellae TaxID=3064388 RepID=A0ABT9J3B5_9BACL|nr:hypothetical protein [Chengkuizengella sp. 2205SS18-9]MDP5276102.1 hypothetical protein [Chengkuizengella sp. 2205SS18-9]